MNKYYISLNMLWNNIKQAVIKDGMLEQDKKNIQELVDKATPAKPIIEWSRGVDVYRCPNCREYIAEVKDRKFNKRKHIFKHTNCCGKKLDWRK